MCEREKGNEFVKCEREMAGTLFSSFRESASVATLLKVNRLPIAHISSHLCRSPKYVFSLFICFSHLRPFGLD